MPAKALDAASDVLNRADALLELEQVAQPDLVKDDLRRMALALGVAALDTYLHWAIRGVEIHKIPTALANLDVTFGELVEMGTKSVAARKHGINDRPATRARYVLNEKLLTMTFQSAKQVEAALAMVGVKKCWTKLAATYSTHTTPADLRQKLNDLSHRRNKIVHEGDIRRRQRPQKITHEKIRRSDVESDLAWLRRFVTALDHVI